MPLSLLSPEAQLLLLTAGGPENDPALRRLLGQRLDWGKLLWLAEHEKATPVLWRRLAGLVPDAIPADAVAQLQRVAMVAEFQMAYLEQRLDETLGALASVGIAPMLLKGAAIAHTVYGSFQERPMGDLDLLVEPHRARDAQEVALRSGWVLAEGLPSSAESHRLYAGHHHLPPLDDARRTGIKLELHTALFPAGHPFGLLAEAVWARARATTARRRTVMVPDVVHHLLHIGLHFAWSHLMRFSGWRTFRDIDALVRRYAVQWDDVVREATDSRGASGCYWAFRLARNLSGVPIPADVLEALAPPRSARLLDRLERHFTVELLPTESVCPSVRLAYMMWGLGVMPRWSGHGAARPWDGQERIRARVRARVPVGPRQRAMNQIRNAVGWHRYVRTMLG